MKTYRERLATALDYHCFLLLSTFFFLLSPVAAQPEQYDGLELVQQAGRFKLDRHSIFHFAVVKNSANERRMALFIELPQGQARFYLDSTRWAQFRQWLEQSDSVQPPERGRVVLGEVQGLKVGNSLASLRLEVIGQTRLDNRRLMIVVRGRSPESVRQPLDLTQKQTEDSLTKLEMVNTILKGYS